MTHSTLIKSVLKGASALILGVMTITSIGAFNGAQAAKRAGADAMATTSTSGSDAKMQLACYRDANGRRHNCTAMCGVRG